MMMVQLDDTGRIKAYGDGLAGGTEVTIPEGVDPFDCVVEGGACVAQAPVGDPTEDALVEIASLAADNAARLDEQDAALCELAALLEGGE